MTSRDPSLPSPISLPVQISFAKVGTHTDDKGPLP